MTSEQGKGSDVEYRWSDSSCSTGDYYLRTKDGQVWKSEQSPGYQGTGERRAVLIGNKVYPT